MLKKTVLAVMALSVSSLANAAMYAPEPAPTCSPGNVTIPCEAKAWDLGIQALYLKAVGDADHGYYFSNNNAYNEYDLDWGWGYRLEGSYHFGTGNDVTATWVHYDHTSTFNANLGPIGQGVVWGNQIINVNPRLEQVNFVFGQHVDAGMSKNLRFYGGLQYNQIHKNLGSFYAGLIVPPGQTAPVTSQYQIDVMRKFSGLGPVIGTDFSYDFGNGFSVTANAAASLSYGTSKAYYTHYNNVVPGVIISSASVSNKMVVPEVEAKLGASYTHTMENGSLTLEGGYQAMNYFNAMVVSKTTLPMPVPVPTSVTNSDFGLYGPYFGVKWVGSL